MKSKLSPEEKAEIATRKRNRPINKQIRGARGVTVDIPLGTPESSKQMSSFIRASTGRRNGRDKSDIMAAKRLAVAQGYLINSKGEIIADIRTDAEKEEQDGHK